MRWRILLYAQCEECILRYVPASSNIHDLWLISFVKATPNDTIFGDPDTHILYITASATNESIPIFHRTSPTAILDHFVGNTRDIAAPEWMAWDRVELQFRQPRSSIADIFARLAVSDHNSLEV